MIINTIEERKNQKHMPQQRQLLLGHLYNKMKMKKNN
jgi:hypothetical protein